MTIFAGEDRALLTVLTTGLEADADGGRTVTAVIAPGEGYQVGAPASASASVTPGHQPLMVIIAAGDSPVTEGSTASWTLSATPAPTTELTVNLNWTQSGSFLPETRPQTVTIPVSGAATVSVDTMDDSTDEPNGTVTLSVVGGSGYSVGSSNTATVTVSDNDPAGPIVATMIATQTQVTEKEEGEVRIEISRAFASGGTVKVIAIDSHASNKNHSFNFGTVETSRTFNFIPPEVCGNQENRIVVISFRELQGYTVGSPGSVTFSIVDSGTQCTLRQSEAFKALLAPG